MSTSGSLLDPVGTLSVYQGETKTFYLEFFDNDGGHLNLTDYVVYFTVKYNYGSNVLIRKTSNSITEILVTDLIGGLATLFLLSGDTEHMDSGSYLYDIWITSLTEKYIIMPPTTFKVLPPVTRFA